MDNLQDISKVYHLDEDGFSGSIEAYWVPIQKENLKNWLASEVDDDETIYNIIKNLTSDILIIKNINVDEEFRGQGFGSDIICNAINNSYASSAILICDIAEDQKKGFILEEFYKENGFETVLIKDNYPLMVFPETLAIEIKKQLKNNKKLNLL